MPAAKQYPTHTQSPPPQEKESMLSFIPSGMPRSIAEYVTAFVPGAVLLFAFFLAAEVLVIVLKNDLVAAAFLPVVCLMPLLSGVVSTLVLEKIRKKVLTMQRAAIVGAVAGLSGALLSAVFLVAVQLFLHKNPFGSALSGLIFYFALLVIVVMEAVLGALGGVLVVKFIKEV